MHQYKGHPHLIHLTGKSKLIHVYRDLCAEGAMTRRQAIENQLIKKLGKSAYACCIASQHVAEQSSTLRHCCNRYGGVNLSIFIPPGHSAPMWNVMVPHWRRNKPHCNAAHNAAQSVATWSNALQRSAPAAL
jgi:hypothetical protein